MRHGDRHRLGVVEIDDLYDNTIHSAIECVLLVYLAKECEKALRREFGSLEGERKFFLKESQRLQTQVNEVEGMIKGTFESMDKLQENF